MTQEVIGALFAGAFVGSVVTTWVFIFEKIFGKDNDSRYR